MEKGSHKTITVKRETWEELMRIKYARNFETVDDVISDLLNDEISSEDLE